MGLHQQKIALDSLAGENWNGKRVLDIGCSDGNLTNEVLKETKAGEIVGIDINPERVKKAQTKFRNNPKLVFMLADAEDLSCFDDDSFDIVFSNMTFQQFKNPKKALEEVFRVIKPGGRAIVNFNEEKSPFWVEREKIIQEKITHNQKEISIKKRTSGQIFQKLAEESGFSSVNIKVIDHIYYYPDECAAFDSDDTSFYSNEKVKMLTSAQLSVLESEFRKYLNSIKSDKGVPEKWKMVFAILVK